MSGYSDNPITRNCWKCMKIGLLSAIIRYTFIEYIAIFACTYGLSYFDDILIVGQMNTK